MTEESQEQTETDDAPEGNPEAEAKAREQGWRPEEDWKGDREGWLPADDFLARNERLQKRGDKILQAQLTKTNGELTELKATIADLGDHLTKADQRAYARAIKDLKTTADQAAKAGDTDAYEDAQRKIEETQKDAEASAKAAPKPKPAAKPNPDEDPGFQDFMADNPWYDPGDAAFDPELSDHAERISRQIGKIRVDGKPLVGKAFYDRIAGDVKRKFPERFGNTRRQRPSAVEGGGPRHRANGKGYADLPPEAKTACDRFTTQKVWSDIKAKDDADYAKQARARYCQDYFGEE